MQKQSLITLSTIKEAYEIALIRNECRHFMTNDQREIAPEKQKKWFEGYLTQNPITYRVWYCLKEGKIVGYIASKEGKEGYYITEAVLESERGKGVGTFLLKTLLAQEQERNKPFLADIFNTNIASIGLHQKFGFTPYKKINETTTRYVNANFSFKISLEQKG